jgi:hypothetical protein
VSGLRFLLCFSFCLTISAMAKGAIEEPKPVYTDVYVSVYEQNILLEVIKGGQADGLQMFLAPATGMDREQETALRAGLEAFIAKMQQRQSKLSSDKALLDQLFYTVHRKYLKEYKPYMSFFSLLDQGAYNCLTATALYAILLDELGISYQVYETDYHIFLLAETAEGEQILLETTDPLYGFVSGREEIKQRIKDICNDALAEGEVLDRPYFDFDLQVFRPINLQQLAGLQYYNQAAYLYNTQRPGQAAVSLSKGRLLYQAERFDKLAQLLAAIQ